MVVEMVVKYGKRGICSAKNRKYAEFSLSLQQIPRKRRIYFMGNHLYTVGGGCKDDRAQQATPIF